MHRDVVNWVTVTKTDFIITTSIDGHLKFWKKKATEGIEFVKHYKAHLNPIINVAASHDGVYFATIAAGSGETGMSAGSGASMGIKGGLKVFDVVNFDMINMIALDYVPKAICWVHRRGQAQALIACTDADSPLIRIYDGRGDGKPLLTVSHVHAKPVTVMSYNQHFHCVVSADENGMMEYWTPEEPFDKPNTVFDMKSSTDMYEFRKAKTVPTSICMSPDGSHFVTMSTDRQVRLFRFKTAKMARKYDESLQAISEMQQACTAAYKMDDMEFGRRLAQERELERSELQRASGNAVFDESGHFIIYGTMLGVKIVNTYTNRVSRLLGKDETHRFLNVGIYQGAPQKKGITTLAMAASDNPLLNEKGTRDPILFSSAFKRPRFYMFGQVDGEASDKGDRDVFNEKPTREEQSMAMVAPTTKKQLETTAIIHTTMGDITLRLFPQYAPKAVENFVTLSKDGYYDGIIFHRVIKKFMLQTGDPLGDGTGGESMWGGNFEDEFHPGAKHDRPYTLSMANAGPGTNGSQFFITTVPTPWLDNKHTVFGRAISGIDTIHAIEDAKVNPMDKPWEDIKIVNISVR